MFKFKTVQMQRTNHKLKIVEIQELFMFENVQIRTSFKFGKKCSNSEIVQK
jgi:hypothetical protein